MSGWVPREVGIDDGGWEARMAPRAATGRIGGWRRRAQGSPYGVFEQWRRRGDPEEILPEILAARCLGISYGDPGPKLLDDRCRQCWGDRHVWLGNGWGLQHQPPGRSSCRHVCHAGEIILAAS